MTNYNDLIIHVQAQISKFVKIPHLVCVYTKRLINFKIANRK